jgi:hypothetical protein
VSEEYNTAYGSAKTLDEPPESCRIELRRNKKASEAEGSVMINTGPRIYIVTIHYVYQGRNCHLHYRSYADTVDSAEEEAVNGFEVTQSLECVIQDIDVIPYT